MDVVTERLRALTRLLLEALSATPGATVYGPRDPQRQTAAVSFTLADVDSAELGTALDHRFNIMTRTGLHCSPAAHRTIGTFRRTRGTVRVSPGLFNTAEQVGYFGRCLRQLQQEHAGSHGV